MTLAASLFFIQYLLWKSMTCWIPMLILNFVSRSLAASYYYDAGGDTFCIQKFSFQKYHIQVPMCSPYFAWVMLTASDDDAGGNTFVYKKNPTSILYRFVWCSPILYEWCSQHQMMMLAAILFAYTNSPSKKYLITIPMLFPDFV
jgi:hypothetical protein